MPLGDEDLGRAVLRLVTDPSAMKAGLAAGKAEALDWTRSTQKALAAAGAQMDRTGQQMTLGITAPVLAAGAAIVKTGLDFDTTLRQIVGLTDVTADQIGGIRDRVLELGGRVGKTPQELAEAFYFVASAGFEADEAMDVLETSATASAAGLGRVQDVAKVLGLTINAYGKENITAARAGDVLTAAINKGTAEADEFAGVLGRVVPTAAQMGVSFDQVTAALAAMTLTGLSAEEASTSLNQVLVSLLKPTVEAAGAMEDMGLNAQGLRDQLREKGLLDTLRTLEERFEGNDEAASKVFGNVRALRGVLSLLQLDSEQLADVFGDVAKASGDLAKGYEETEGPARALARSQARLDAVLTELSVDVLPVVVELFENVASVVESVSGWFKALPAPVRDTVIQFAALLAALGPILLVGGKLVGAFAGLWAGVGKVAALLFGKLIPAFAATRLAGGPLLIVLGALIDVADKMPKMMDAVQAANDALAAGDLDGQIAALEEVKANISDFVPVKGLMVAALDEAIAKLDEERRALFFASGGVVDATAVHEAYLSKMSLVPEANKRVAVSYEDLGDVVAHWSEMTEAEHKDALQAQLDYTSDALKALQSFRTEIEEAYKAAVDAELDFERTAIAIAQKQQELTALDKEYVKHKATMTKLEVREYQLRRAEIIAEQNQLKLHLALIGDDIQKTTRLTALLTSKEMKEGLTSEFPETRAAYEALEAKILLSLNDIERRGGPAARGAAAVIAAYLNPRSGVSPLDLAKMANWGDAIGRAYSQAIAAAIARAVGGAIWNALSQMRALLESGSPPKSPRNPLHRIDRWGAATGSAWVDPFVATISGAIDRIRGPLDAAGRALATPFALPSTFAAAAAGASLASAGIARRTDGLLGAAGVPAPANGNTYQTTLVMPDARNRDPFDVLDRAARYQRFGLFAPGARKTPSGE